MGGFANLKKAFEESDMMGTFKETPALVDDAHGIKELPIFLMLRCLFEIAGNLDTIAVEMRKINQREAERFLLTKESLLNMRSDGENLDFRKPGKKISE